MTDNIDSTLKERGSRYGSFECNASLTQDLMHIVECHPGYEKLTQMHIEAYHMIFHKIARSMCGDCMYEDNPHDIAGYATLLEEYIREHNNDS